MSNTDNLVGLAGAHNAHVAATIDYLATRYAVPTWVVSLRISDFLRALRVAEVEADCTECDAGEYDGETCPWCG